MESEGIFKKTARFIKYNSRFVLVILFFTGLISLAVFGNKGIIQRYKLESEKKDLELQLEAEYKKSEDLKKEIEALNVSDEKLEEVAREKFGMTKEGEIIQKVITDTTSQQNDK
jgi:cell division protein FtsB